jgi:ankyrin repeat protein
MNSFTKYGLVATLAFYAPAICPASSATSEKTTLKKDDYTIFMAGLKTQLQVEWHKYVKRIPTAITAHNINATTFEQQTALHMRAHFSWDEEDMPTIATLLGYGAHVNAKDSDGNTPLHIAVSRKHIADEKVVQALIDGKSDLTLTNNSGYTAQVAESIMTHNVPSPKVQKMKFCFNPAQAEKKSDS